MIKRYGIMAQCNSYCCKKKREKLVLLTFSREQLLYDIKNYTWIEGDVMLTDAPHRRHPVQDIGEDGNVDRVTRVLDLAYEEAVDMLYPYSKQTFERLTPQEGTCRVPAIPDADVSKDDLLDETATYEISLKVPDDFSITTVNLLERLVHEYLVYRVIEDWLGITYPEAGQKWALKMQAIKDRLEQCINARTGRVRRTLSPW